MSDTIRTEAERTALLEHLTAVLLRLQNAEAPKAERNAVSDRITAVLLAPLSE